jgi:hypothetical protein
VLDGVAEREGVGVQAAPVAPQEARVLEAEGEDPVAGAAQIVVDEVAGGEGVIDHDALADLHGEPDDVATFAGGVDGEAAGAMRRSGVDDGVVEVGEESLVGMPVELGEQPEAGLALQAAEPGRPGRRPVRGNEERDRRVVAAVGSDGGIDGEHGVAPMGRKAGGWLAARRGRIDAVLVGHRGRAREALDAEAVELEDEHGDAVRGFSGTGDGAWPSVALTVRAWSATTRSARGPATPQMIIQCHPSWPRR